MMSRRILPSIIAALCGLVLFSGCATTPPGGASASGTTSPAATSSATDPSPTGASPALEGQDDTRNSGARQAIETVEDRLGGRATRLEWTGAAWKADVVVGDTKHSVEVNAAGDAITKDVVATQKISPAQVEQLSEAFVTMRQAVDTVLDQVPGDFEKTDLVPDDAPRTGMRWDVFVEVSPEVVALSVDGTTGDVRE